MGPKRAAGGTSLEREGVSNILGEDQILKVTQESN